MLVRKYHNPEDEFVNYIMQYIDLHLFELNGIPAYKKQYHDVPFDEVKWDFLTGEYLCLSVELSDDKSRIVFSWWDGIDIFYMSYDNPYRMMDWLLFRCKYSPNTHKRQELYNECVYKFGIPIGTYFEIVDNGE